MSDIISDFALALSVLTLIVLIVFFAHSRKARPTLDPISLRNAINDSLRDKDNQESLKNLVKVGISESDSIKDKFKATIVDLKMDTELSSLRQSADQLLEEQRRITEVFSGKGKRASYAEMRLEEIMKDYFGSEWVHVREKISAKVEIPDVHLDTPQGKLCIDAKFPLENYRILVTAKDEKSREKANKEFEKDIARHIVKVSQYVKPEEGTARVALMYIPADSIYAYIADDKPDLMSEAARSNVLIVSPSSIIPQLAVIRSYIETEKIVKYVDEVKRKIEGHQRRFAEIVDDWEVLKGHIDDASKKSGVVNSDMHDYNLDLKGLLTTLDRKEREDNTN